MANAHPSADLGGVQVAILAKAPLPGYAKTRLVPALGARGAARSQRGLFEGMGWSTDRVMADTRARAAALGLRVHEGAVPWDLDEPADLVRYRRMAGGGPSAGG